MDTRASDTQESETNGCGSLLSPSLPPQGRGQIHPYPRITDFGTQNHQPKEAEFHAFGITSPHRPAAAASHAPPAAAPSYAYAYCASGSPLEFASHPHRHEGEGGHRHPVATHPPPYQVPSTLDSGYYSRSLLSTSSGGSFDFAPSPIPSSLSTPPRFAGLGRSSLWRQKSGGSCLEDVDEETAAMGNDGSRPGGQNVGDNGWEDDGMGSGADEYVREYTRGGPPTRHDRHYQHRSQQHQQNQQHIKSRGHGASNLTILMEQQQAQQAAAKEALAALALDQANQMGRAHHSKMNVPAGSPASRRATVCQPQFQAPPQIYPLAAAAHQLHPPVPLAPSALAWPPPTIEDHQHKPQLRLIPPPSVAAEMTGRSAPSVFLLPPSSERTPIGCSQSDLRPSLVGGVGGLGAVHAAEWPKRGSIVMPTAAASRLFRCASNREMSKNMPPAPLSTSPYMALLCQKQAMEIESQNRFIEARMASLRSTPIGASSTPSDGSGSADNESDSSKAPPPERRPTTSEARNRRRAEHNRAVIDDLCEIVSDLFLAESKLLCMTEMPTSTLASSSVAGPASRIVGNERDGDGHSKIEDNNTAGRLSVLVAVRQFLSDLPPRYALGVERPTEVLVHMRLMAAARADDTRAAVHIANLEDYDKRGRGKMRNNASPVLRLVTISCADCDGLLEFITKLLGTGGARVIDADVMLTTDAIVLDRFVVEMKGRLRLDKLQQYIESYLNRSRKNQEEDAPTPPTPLEEKLTRGTCSSEPFLSSLGSSQRGSMESSSAYGPVYFHSPKHILESPRERLQEEMQMAIPLSEIMGSAAAVGRSPSRVRSNSAAGRLYRQISAPMQQASSPASSAIRPAPSLRESVDVSVHDAPVNQMPSPSGQPSRECKDKTSVSSRLESLDVEAQQQAPTLGGSAGQRRRRLLVDRPAVNFGSTPDSMSNVVAAQGMTVAYSEDGNVAEDEDSGTPDLTTRQVSGLTLAMDGGQKRGGIPLIPFEELMLLETLGSGRVSTIYRAAWQPRHPSSLVADEMATMVALKVATVEPSTGDVSPVEELRQEADIASILDHNNICSLVGVACDAECFCLAYEFCEGGSLLSLLSDASRCYEYLPIALDIANGMAYLHSRNIIHRDLKPSNILMTKDSRAKISDFGMSVTNFGQELTAETGTYRWMAPEVIRHESYSSNADVYSFGIVLWQLITREVPFATLSPIQTAYAVAEGERPIIPESTPDPLRRIICACWDEDSHKRPSFTYIAMALADYARMAFSPANVGAQTVRIANEMLANVEGNSTVNVDFSTPVMLDRRLKQHLLGPNGRGRSSLTAGNFFLSQGPGSFTGNDVGLQI